MRKARQGRKKGVGGEGKWGGGRGKVGVNLA